TVARLQRPLSDANLRRTVPAAAAAAALATRRSATAASHPAEAAADFPRDAYLAAAGRIQEYIRDGDAFQVVLSQRLRVPLQAHPFSLYRALRRLNPSPYMFYLNFGTTQLAGASPEMLVRVEGGRVTTRPIAGTRPRGSTPAEDQALERDLLVDQKELAEHAMLLDLGRNDVGRVSAYGTVKVAQAMQVERYSHVMHLVSEVTGELAPGLDAVDALAACFPAGTLTGAPKVRAMQIIDELEPVRRGPYGGAVGYLGFAGSLDACIAIRAAVVQGGIAYIQAGAGIVADSQPQREYEECRNKAAALLRAVEQANAEVEGDAWGGALVDPAAMAAERGEPVAAAD
ncbi:MAG: anthranilate synthase component I family protein, partial [Bacillota bacterium]